MPFYQDSFFGYELGRHHYPLWVMAMYYPQVFSPLPPLSFLPLPLLFQECCRVFFFPLLLSSSSLFINTITLGYSSCTWAYRHLSDHSISFVTRYKKKTFGMYTCLSSFLVLLSPHKDIVIICSIYILYYIILYLFIYVTIRTSPLSGVLKICHSYVKKALSYPLAPSPSPSLPLSLSTVCCTIRFISSLICLRY